jgi:tetratricopeptide (TPR) repeat protein
LDDGLFWQYDVRDGMEESISGSRTAENARPTINSYMYGDALAIAKIAEMAGRADLAERFRGKALTIKDLVLSRLWDKEASFFKVRLEDGSLADVREAIGFIPWYFNLPDAGYEAAWTQAVDPEGFRAPFGLTTAERRHPQFRTHGVGTCEWDGAVWPFATSQTLVAMANVVRNYDRAPLSARDYFEALLTYAKAQHRNGKPYIGEYQDEKTGAWLKGDSPRSRYYNHSTFCDLVIAGLVGLRPRADDTLVVHPLVPGDAWDWFALDCVPYHGRTVTILWDRTGGRYGKGKGLHVFADGTEIAGSKELDPVSGGLP